MDSLHSDAVSFHTEDSLDEETKKEIEKEVKEAERDVAEALKSVPSGKLGAQPVRSAGYHHTSHGGHYIPMSNTVNQFNILGGSIGQAAIGNIGPTTFNSEKKVFKDGAENTDIKISGGNFTQANVAGEVTYNNKNATIAAGTGSQGSGVTPEKLLQLIFEKGVTVEELTKLLEARYSLANIAFSMPKDVDRKERMIRALLME